ncbi:MAG TPA: isocitrate lyase/PEP mutase family protein [Acidimicrobiales bacterium]|nr:isocitrate lyase/PEP mutase family protein [Acidimicrobiales bacterium]
MSGTALRHRLQRRRPTLAPGVWDPLSARLAAQAGFDVLFVSGYCVSGTLLGLPDLGYLTQTEMADAARRIHAAAPDALLLVDADTGYGDERSVRRTVELWEAAGASGIFLEDQVWPKRCGHMAGKEVVARADWLAKLQAALDHREHLHVTARTDARAPLGLDEAIARGRAALDLGVDAVFVEAPSSIEDFEAIAAALPEAVLVANMVETGRTPLLTPDELADLGVTLVLSPVSALFAATKAMGDTFALLAGHGTLRGHLERLVSFDDFADVVDLAAHRADALAIHPPADPEVPTSG